MFTLHTLTILYEGKVINLPDAPMGHHSSLIRTLRGLGVEFSILSITPSYKLGW